MATIDLNTLVNFNLTDGSQPYASLIIDTAGDLFGTTNAGGTNNAGTVFEVVNTSTGYASSSPTLASFNDTDGAGPLTAGVIEDAAGNLFGTTEQGGANGAGTVFELAITVNGYASAPTDVVSLFSNNFASPVGGLIVDPAGDLITAINTGTLVEVAKTAGGYASTATTLVTFKTSAPVGDLIEDASGNLFGMTQFGGTDGYGTIFEVPYTNGSYAATPATLVSFNGTDGASPAAGLVMDAAGNLFGATSGGGTGVGGTVFELAKIAGGWASTPVVLVSFSSATGYGPVGNLLIDAAGNLFGTTLQGGSSSDGTVFEIAKTDSGYASTPTTLVNFNGTNGSRPHSGLVADAAGNLFGTTLIGGTNGDGTAFELTGTGFQVSCYRRGTRIATATGDRTVESLAAGDTVLTASGETRPIKWIGRRNVDCRRHPRPEKVWPVRVSAGAFGDGIPHRDLWLSPDHAVFVDDVLIPIKYLVNGVTIDQVPGDEVTYYHIELAQHDVLLAEGLPAESYLDTGDRRDFENGGGPVFLRPDFSVRMWEAMGRAPLILNGQILEAVRRRVNARLDGFEPKEAIRRAAI
jgi:uncharacterized repeat protein (TIGR03803 family)